MEPGVNLTLTGADVPGLGQVDIGIRDGVIASPGVGKAIDLGGLILCPGIVDAHGDGFERHLAPRRGAGTDLAQGLRATEAELLANGITTAMLAQFWSWEGGMRSAEFARGLAAALEAFVSVPDMRMLLRLEMGCFEDFEAVAAFVKQHGIGYLVVSDHLPHKALSAGRRVPRLEGQALKAGRSPEAHQALLERLFAQLPQARAELPALARRFARMNVRMGSHDDGSPKMRAAHREMGLRIAEFPLDLPTAQAARAEGDPVVMGAPNLVRGGSHKKGGTAAMAVIEAGACDALASDYHYPSCLGAARRLVREGWALADAWRLISDGPARLLGLTDRGRVEPGLRADLVILSPDLSKVHGTIAGGRVALADAVLAERILA